MKAFLLGATVLSILATLVVSLIPLSSDFTSVQKPVHQVLGESNEPSSIDISEYLDEKLTNEKPENSFGELVEGFSSLITKRIYASTPSAELESASSSATTTLPSKKSYTIGLVGDSMIDTMGGNLPELASVLKSRFPGVTFRLLNYGAGATNIDSAEDRLHNSFNYLGTTKPPLFAEHPDIIVLESFAYNHWDNTQSDLDRQWLAIAHLTDVIKSALPDTKIVLAATIAPHCPTYTDGSANLAQPRKQIECDAVKAYLQNMVNFATGQKYPLANAYHASLSGGDGNPKYINGGDHIHPSTEGKILFSQKIADALQSLLKSEEARPQP